MQKQNSGLDSFVFGALSHAYVHMFHPPLGAFGRDAGNLEAVSSVTSTACEAAEAARASSFSKPCADMQHMATPRHSTHNIHHLMFPGTLQLSFHKIKLMLNLRHQTLHVNCIKARAMSCYMFIHLYTRHLAGLRDHRMTCYVDGSDREVHT